MTSHAAENQIEDEDDDEDEYDLAGTDYTTLITALLITDYSFLWQANKSRASMR